MEQLFNQKTLMMSTLNAEGMPCISYAPFVKVGEKVYIYISKAAEHYYNVSENPKLSVMMIEDEVTAKTVFARVRVSFEGTATKLETIPEDIWQAFDQAQQSELLEVLRNMDFDMFEVELHKGRLVEGFGRAYDIHLENGEWVREQVMGMGHRRG